MNDDWQSWAALAVVAATAGLFVWRFVRKRRRAKANPGCVSDCGCSATKSGLGRLGAKKGPWR